MPRRPKPCIDCGRDFVPTSGHTKRCASCRASYAAYRQDPPLSPAIRAYLDDFTRFILEGKSTGDPDRQEQAARDKAASLAVVIDEAATTPSERGQRIAGFPKGHSFKREAA
jgi:hypothetical protein